MIIASNHESFLLTAALSLTFAACAVQDDPLGELDEEDIASESALDPEPEELADESAPERSAPVSAEDLVASQDQAAFWKCNNMPTCEDECDCLESRCQIDCIPDGMNPTLCYDYCLQQYETCIDYC